MAGLFASVMAGAGAGAANAEQQNTAAGQNMNLQQMQIEVRDMMNQRAMENARADESSRYDRTRADAVADMGTKHQNRLDEIKAMRDPNDAKLKALQLKQVMEDSKVPPTVKTEYKSLDDSAKVIEAAMAKSTAEGAGDPAGISTLTEQLGKIKARQQELLSSLPDYVAKKGSSLDDLFPVKPKPGQADTSGKDW